MNIDSDELATVLAEWLGDQRWFAGKSRAGKVSVRLLATLATEPDALQIWLADVDYPDGSRDTYQVPILARRDPYDSLQHANIGSIVDAATGHPIELYDALQDKDVTGVWLRQIQLNEPVDGVSFTRTGEPESIPVEATSIVMTAQQSNTSLIYGDIAIMKVFRRLAPGLNPDIEIHDALTKLGARHIASLLGHVSTEIDGELYSLAMVQEYMTTASDGWDLAKTSVRDLMAEGDLHAEEAGGDFAAEAHRLGVSTAEVHADLAQAFGTAQLDHDELARRARQMNARLDAALHELPELADVADGLRARYDALVESAPITAQRIHGDLHLGQVLRTVHRWVFLDFEGEPAKTIDERRTFDSPLRDIAGMLRSFDYAAQHQRVDVEPTSQSQFRAVEWADRNRAAFCAGYAEAAGFDPQDSADLLAAFEADKAVYEAVYESRSRPRWLPIPLASLHRLSAAGV